MDAPHLSIYIEQKIPYFRIQAKQVKALRAALPRVTITWCRTPDSFLRSLKTADIVLANRFKQPWFDAAPRLRHLFTPAAGHDVMNVIPPASVQMHYSTHHGPIMAETVLGLMLAMNRGLYTAYRSQLQHELWNYGALDNLRLLHGSHAVIFGFGHIGACIGACLKPFNVRITGIRRSRLDERPAWFTPEDALLSPKHLLRTLKTADHLILVLPSGAETTHLIGARELSQLPRHAVIYNVGRGNCIDEDALAAALRGQRIAGACLDVYEHEPLTEVSPLAQNLPGLVRLPHASCFAPIYVDWFIRDVIPQIEKLV